MDKIKTYIVPHLVGFLLIIIGWGIAVIYTGLDKFASKEGVFNASTIAGLVLIIIGAYLPEVWIAIANKKK